MNFFYFYYQLGISHILDLMGYDHLLFIITLSAVYQYTDWRRMLILISSFTIGHSLTLALATLGFVIIPANLVEILIPVTILITSIANLVALKGYEQKPNYYLIKYGLSLLFGLIHGLGFSNFLRAIFTSTNDIILPLLAFNLGLETGQIITIAFVLVIGFVCIHKLKLKQQTWTQVLSGIAAIVSIWLIITRSFFS
jgi:hypothetical protein